MALLVLHAACAPGREVPESGSAPADTASLPTLELGEEIEIEIEPGQSRFYRIEARAGELIHVVVDQRGIDVIARLLDPDDVVLVQSDRAIDDVGPEPLLALARLPRLPGHG